MIFIKKLTLYLKYYFNIRVFRSALGYFLDHPVDTS